MTDNSDPSSSSESSNKCTERDDGSSGDKTIIDKILGEMKCQFNKNDNKKDQINELINESSPLNSSSISQKTDEFVGGDVETAAAIATNETPTVNGEEEIIEKLINGENEDDENNGKPRIVLLFKKPNNTKVNKAEGRRSPRRKSITKAKSNNNDEKNNKTTERVVKRSARRRSKDCNESVLQSAIARKEKSYNETINNKPQRATRQLKPTQKILDNLAIATAGKHHDNNKINKNGKTQSDNENNNEKTSQRKQKANKHYTKRSKKIKLEDSDSDEEKKVKNRVYRRSRRISSGRHAKEETSQYTEIMGLPKEEEEVEEEEEEEKDIDNLYQMQSTVGAELIASRLCLCVQKSNCYISVSNNNNEIVYCTAVDSINNKLIGCSNKIDDGKDILMFRPSTRVPYGPLCLMHRNRLWRHNCCPNCGIFCTQGLFTECKNKHQYHRECQISVGNKKCCPHCGDDSPEYNVTITMSTNKKPIFLPHQKPYIPTARITLQDTCIQEDEELINSLKSLKNLSLPTDTLDECFDINDLVLAIKDECAERVAFILSTKTVNLTTKLEMFNDGTVLHLAAQNGLLTIVHMLIVSGLQADIFDKEQNTPLMLAVLNRKNDIVQYLIRTGASVDLKGTDGMTALHLAAKCGNLKACELLLKSVNRIRNYVNCCDDGGWTPLVWACEHGFADIASYLIDKGADPSIRDVEHNVALHWAAFSGSSHIIEYLLNLGCEVNAVNAHGDTPLHIGARHDMYECIIILLARGANVTLLNKINESPLDCVPPDGDSYHPISLNLTLQASIDFECQKIILTNDISKGKETNPIQCYNDIDDEPKPMDFIYINKNCLTSEIKIDSKITSLQCCTCSERCVEDDCYCGKLSYKCWYNEDGRLLPEFNYNDIPMIFECNDNCSCNYITCNNRVVQKGIQQRFELFRTRTNKGWGIRTLKLIQKGSFVCEYIGEIITDQQADERDDDSFLFDLENRICKTEDSNTSYCIDAKFYGNFSRFINHSCNPNLTSVKVFIEHQDLRFPRIAFFATRDILPNEELGYDYGEKFWMAKYKLFTCHCNSPDCKYSKETIQSTVENYQRIMEECNE